MKKNMQITYPLIQITEELIFTITKKDKKINNRYIKNQKFNTGFMIDSNLNLYQLLGINILKTSIFDFFNIPVEFVYSYEKQLDIKETKNFIIQFIKQHPDSNQNENGYELEEIIKKFDAIDNFSEILELF